MSAEKLRPLIQAVKDNPEDIWAWMQLGNVAKLMEDLNTAYHAYMAGIRLCADNEEIISKIDKLRSDFLNQLDDGSELLIRIFKLPKNTAVLLLKGVINTDVKELEYRVKVLTKKNYKDIALDLSGVEHISGLGPSCFRNLTDYVARNNGNLVVVCQKKEIGEVLSLKKIALKEYPDISDFFQTLPSD